MAKRRVEMEEKAVVNSYETKAGGSGGRIIGLIGIVIGIIALVIALSNVGVKEQLAKVEKRTKELAKKESVLEKKTANLEIKAVQMELLSSLDRIYVLTMIDRDYSKAAGELAKAEGLYAQIKGYLSKEKAQEVDSALEALKAEIEKGPSPIPQLIAKLRSDLSAKIAAVEVKAPEEKEVKVEEKAPVREKVEKKEEAVKKAEEKKEVEKKVEKKEEKTEAKKEEIKKSPAKPKKAEEEKASGLKSVYLFWKSIGEKLAK